MQTLEFEPGLTLLRVPSPRSPIVHRLTCERLAAVEPDGAGSAGSAETAYWIDARNAAATHVLYDCASSPRVLEPLRIARAFTAYQHHSLVREVAREASPGTPLLVATNVADLYRDDDLPEWEREDLLASTLATLGELGRTLEVPVLATAAGGDESSGSPAGGPIPIADYADHEVECTRTREGLRLDGDGAETVGYWHRDYWQTTIPYWVDLCGSVEAIDPVVAAHERGLFDLGPAMDGDETGYGADGSIPATEPEVGA